MRARASLGLAAASIPSTVTFPEPGSRNPVIIRIVVVFPAPFGPRKPRISPLSTRNDTSSTATVP